MILATRNKQEAAEQLCEAIEHIGKIHVEPEPVDVPEECVERGLWTKCTRIRFEQEDFLNLMKGELGPFLGLSEIERIARNIYQKLTLN